MAELYRHTDEDGDTLSVVEAVEVDSRYLAAKIGDEKGWSSVAYLDKHAARRLAAALVGYYGPEELTEKEERHG